MEMLSLTFCEVHWLKWCLQSVELNLQLAVGPTTLSHVNSLILVSNVPRKWNWMSMKHNILPVSCKALLNIYICMLKASGAAFCNSPVSALWLTCIKQICIYAIGHLNWIKSEPTSLSCFDIKFTFLNFHFRLTHEVSTSLFHVSWSR